jgi:hypothetical protein
VCHHSSFVFHRSPARRIVSFFRIRYFIDKPLGNKLPTGEDAFHLPVPFADSHQQGAVDVMDEEGNQKKHDQEMRAANPLNIDETGNPPYE